MENDDFRKIVKIIENSNIDYIDRKFILIYVEELLKEVIKSE